MNGGSAAAEVRIIQSDVAEDIRNPLFINRNDQIVAPYSAGQLNHFVFADGDGIIGETSLPRTQRVTDIVFSNWGFAAETDQNGQVPSDLFAAAIGEEVQFVARAPGGVTIANPDVNDRGTVAWLARDSVTHGLDRLYVWRAGTLPRQLANPPSPFRDYGLVLVDPAETIHATYSTGTGERWGSYTAASGWTTRAAPISPAIGAITSFNALGQTAFKGRTDNGQYGIYIADDQTNTYVMDATELGTFPLFRPTYLTLADDGALLVNMGPQLSDGEWSATLRRPNGSLLDLQTLLPAGYSEPLRPGVALSFDGSKVLLKGRNTADGTFTYFVYDHSGLIPLMEGLSHRIEWPRISNDGGAFFYLKERSGRYSLAYASIPEPGGVMLVALAGVVVAAIRRAPRGKNR